MIDGHHCNNDLAYAIIRFILKSRMVSETGEELVVYSSTEATTQVAMAIAHVSAQAQGIVENQVQLHANQQLQAQQQQQYTETQVQQARIEAKVRTDELAAMIQANTIDPVALENHVNTQLQSVIVAANTEARAAAEEHLNKKTQATDHKMAAVLEQFKTQLRTNVETHVRQVLTAHMEQVGAEIRLAIATQGQELRKMFQGDLTAFQKHITAQLDVAMATTEKKAKAMARRHRAEEGLAHDAIRASIAKGISDCKADAATAAATRAEELFQSFKLHGCGASPSPQTSEAVDSLVCTLPRAILEPSPRSKLRVLEVSDDEEMSSSTEEEKGMFADNDFEAKRHSTKANSATDELLELLRAAQVSIARRSSAQVRLEKVRSSEQSKVSARAQARSKDLTRKSKQSQHSEPALKSRKQKKAPASSYPGQVQDVVKRLSDGRNRKKEQAEEALKLAEFLLKAGK